MFKLFLSVFILVFISFFSFSCSSDSSEPKLIRETKTKKEVSITPQHINVPDNTSYKQASLGIGLATVTYWSTQYPFIDLMKQSREWADLKSKTQEFHVDENGWITKLKPNQTASTVFLTVPKSVPLLHTRAIVFYEGKGEIRYSANARKDVAASKQGRDVIHLKSDNHILEIYKTDPKDYIRNIRIIPERYLDAYERGEIFNEEWTALIKDFYAFRFMDWMKTNNSTQSTWDERPKVNDRTYKPKGVPLEIMIQLANKFNAVPWFNIPHLADENYIKGFAETIDKHLAPHLLVYIEHSNEVWNWQFKQAQYALSTGKARWGEDKGNAHLQWHGMRTAQMCDIFKQGIFKHNKQRVKCVAGVQTAWHGAESATLDCPLWVKEGNKPCYQKGIDYIGITSYFSGGLNGPHRGRDKSHANTILQWAAQGELGIDKAFQQLEDGSLLRHIENYTSYKGAVTDLKRHVDYWSSSAEKRGLGVVAYEGGQHITANAHELQDNEQILAFHTAINRDARMADLYRKLKQVWREHGGELEVYFDDVAPSSKWGSWGMMEHLRDTSAPKYQVIKELNQQYACWWQGCAILKSTQP